VRRSASRATEARGHVESAHQAGPGDERTDDGSTPWFRDFSDAELGAALRVFLSNPDFPQWPDYEQLDGRFRELAAGFRYARSKASRSTALLALFRVSFRDTCDCAATEQCDERCREIEGVGIIEHCAHCDGQRRYCSWPLSRIREFLGLGGKK
jgi:hypothetical protein